MSANLVSTSQRRLMLHQQLLYSRRANQEARDRYARAQLVQGNSPNTGSSQQYIFYPGSDSDDDTPNLHRSNSVRSRTDAINDVIQNREGRSSAPCRG